jgi:iron complex outermembrane receptor protein
MRYFPHRPAYLPVMIATALLFGSILAMSPVAHADEDDELTTIVVTSTRHPRLVGAEPLRVEAVPAEEIPENSTVHVGDVTSLLQELPGIRFDVSSGGLGATGLHLRGLPARHTLVLRDGLPSSGAGTTGFGLLRMPPVDLQRVEVIKGVATPLYGLTALAGVLNLVSTDGRGESVMTVDRSSRGADNVIALLRAEDDAWPDASLTIARSRQRRSDIDGDRWFEIPGYERVSVRPRITVQDDAGRSLFLTAAATDEQRVGGTVDARSALGREFALSSRSKDREAGFIAKIAADERTTTEIRASYRRIQRNLRIDRRSDDTVQAASWFELTHGDLIGAHRLATRHLWRA